MAGGLIGRTGDSESLSPGSNPGQPANGRTPAARQDNGLEAWPRGLRRLLGKQVTRPGFTGSNPVASATDRWKVGRAAYCARLESGRPCKGHVGSNPTPSSTEIRTKDRKHGFHRDPGNLRGTEP